MTDVAVLAGFVAMCLLAQSYQQPSQVRFGTHADEAAHVITSLMIRDYAVSGFHLSPRAFAEQYYLAYPKVAFGIWPPLYHVVAAGWMLVVPASYGGVSLLVATILGTVAFLVYRALRPAQPCWLAIAGGVWCLGMAPIRQWMSSVTLDALVALLCFFAMWVFARFLSTGRGRTAALFALISSAAILTKYNAAALVLLPPLAVIALRRWELIRNRHLWLSALIVLGLITPWFAWQWRLVGVAADPGSQPLRAWAASVINARQIWQMGTPILALCAIAALVRALRPGARHAEVAVCSASLLSATWMLHSLVYPITHSRYLMVCAPCLAVLAVDGLSLLQARSRPTAVALITAALLFPSTSRGAAEATQFQTVAEQLMARPSTAHSVTLVCADAAGEGAFIAEMALRDPARPSVFVLRASKLLADSTWMSVDYRLRFQTPEAVAQLLDRARVSAVVIDASTSGTARSHQALLLNALLANSSTWHETSRIGSLRVFQNPTMAASAQNRPPDEVIRILNASLDRVGVRLRQ